MIIGSGFIANSFMHLYQNDASICIFASGTSNSLNTDTDDFKREYDLIEKILKDNIVNSKLVYFSSCSVLNQNVSEITPYTQHKINMEKLISTHPKHLIIRLPSVAGSSVNPNTLLNFIYSKIKSHESFDLWVNAYRNIIDIDDVVELSEKIVGSDAFLNTTINIANPNNYKMIEIVNQMEKALGKPSIHKKVDKGSEYKIDIEPIQPFMTSSLKDFGAHYLSSTLLKYYQN